MNIKCCICHELFVPSDDVYFTPCGHFFHFSCVSHWLERSKTCPHCRTKVTSRNIHRAYFDFATSDDNTIDTTTLLYKVDNLNLQIVLKDKDLKTCGEENASLKKQAAGLRAEVRKLEVEIDKHRSAIYALKEQVKFFKNASLETDAAKAEVVRLQKKLDDCQNIQRLLGGSQDATEEIMRETQDVATLVTYISVMKREMESCVKRRRELRKKINDLEQENRTVKAERESLFKKAVKCRQLKEDLDHCEGEKKSLVQKLQKLESQINSKNKVSNEDIQRFIAESPAPERIKTLREHEKTLTISDSDTTPVEVSSELSNSQKSSDSSVNSAGASGYSTLNKRRNKLRSPISSLSILTKRPRLTSQSKPQKETKEMHYDGFGGHSKIDHHPSPILNFKPKVLKNNLHSVKVKRQKLPNASNNKLETYFGVVDLT